MSTIYILISVGLVVDYSAHVAHMFATSGGGANVRAGKALNRIGPSVFNAIMSTLLAVVVISFSKSYIFRVFFKVLFLTVVVGGIHGLVLLPVLLSLFGGNAQTSVLPSVAKTDNGEVTGGVSTPALTSPPSSADGTMKR